MTEKMMHLFALSRKGAKDLQKGILATAVFDLVQMLPVFLLYELTAALLNGGVPGGQIPLYVLWTIVCVILIAASYTWVYNATFFATYEESGVRRVHLAEKLRRIPLSWFSHKDLSDLTSTIMADCATLETSNSHWIPQFFASIISTSLISVMLLFFNWKMALAAIWVVPASLLFTFICSKRIRENQVKNNDTILALSDGVQEYLESMRDLRSCNALETYKKGLDQKIKNVEKQTIISELVNAIFNTSAKMVLKLGIASTMITGAVLLQSGQIDLLTFFAFLILCSRFYDPLCGALDNLQAIMMIFNVQSPRLDEILSHDEQTGTDRLTNTSLDVEFDRTRFSYDPQTPVLKDVSFTARQGEVTALVGPSGSGKTTITRLAARFYDPDSGSIKVGGMDVSKVDPETLMSLYSIVFQDVTLFNNTIMENIRLGKEGASDEEVLRAAKLANVDEFALKLPEGYQTRIGENGCELSGGERQRISIARAFLKDAPIILMDEATASLDVDNETAIQSAVSKLIEDKTVILIAHRMRTVANADKIVVLNEGLVAEEGTHEQLMKKNGIYRHMVDLQTRSAGWTMD